MRKIIIPTLLVLSIFANGLFGYILAVEYFHKGNQVYEISTKQIIDYGVGEKPDPVVLPNQTPLIEYGLDEQGVIVAFQPDGKMVYNVFEIATQAIVNGADTLKLIEQNNQKGYIVPRNPDDSKDPSLDNMQDFALRWLINNSLKIKDAMIWYYEFDNAYNDVEIKSPWASAFGQAHVIKAFLSAYQKTKDEKYKELALKAGYAFDIPINEGGFKSFLSNGDLFFEEVPTQKPTHILNGHMVSTIALLELNNVAHDKRISELAKLGLDTIKNNIELYDTGYWSKYDLNPKKGEIILRVAFEDSNINEEPAMAIDYLKFKDKSANTDVKVDLGREDDFGGAWRISGTEWLDELDDEGIARKLIDGRSVNQSPVNGGTEMNTYIIFQLPEWESKLSNLEDPFNIEVEIRYLDLQEKNISLQIQNINEGNYLEFVDIPDANWNTIGDQKWKTFSFTIPSKHLGWYMGPDYQRYHIDLLKQLYQLTNDQFYSDIAERWDTYYSILIDKHKQ